jgi:adenosylcobinamide kinase/adenosylcobinamide-phosphate guanylyltransferase
VVYVATARASDEDMAARIAHHRARRPASWRTVEVATALVSSLPLDARTLIVEDLTLLLSNHFLNDTSMAEERTVAELEALAALSVNVVLVTNEVGMGLVPDNPLGRQFRDALGRVNQRAAALCGEVYLVVAGLPLRMK